MRDRDHAMYETYLIAKEAAENKVSAEKQITELKRKEKDDFFDALNKYRVQGEINRRQLGEMSNALYDNHLQEVLESMFITALEYIAPLTENGYRIAVQSVNNYIKENGGALNIINKNAGKTYVLDRIFEAVITAHDKDMNIFYEAEKADDDEDDKEDEDIDEKKEKHSDGDKNESGEDIKVGDADGDGIDDADSLDGEVDSEEVKKNAEENKPDDKEEKDDSSDDEKSDDKKDDDSKSDEKDEDKSDDTDKDENNLVDDLDKDDEEDNDLDDNGEDDDKQLGIDDNEKKDSDPVTDEPDTKETLDADSEDKEDSVTDDDGNLKDSKEEMFDKLENDDDISDAVDIIAKRISDAETQFIQKNAEDKEKIKNIVNKVDDRIKAVTQSDEDEESKEEAIESEKNESARLITDIKEKRFHSVFEGIVKDNFEYIMKDQELKESYMDIDGSMDMTRIVESSRIMYGFLEFVNSLQLEKVDEDYILKVINREI